MGAIIFGGNFIERRQFSVGQLSSRGIVRGALILWAIIQGAVLQGQLSGGQLSGHQSFRTGMILVNLQKVFDTLDHTLLLQKMKCIDFKESVVKWFQPYLSKRNFL